MNSYLARLRDLQLKTPIYVVGLGLSGQSAVEVLQRAGYAVQGLDEKRGDDFDAIDFAQAGTVVLSPGVDRRRPCFRGAKLINDVELFARVVAQPVAAVTGSNGKSTVVTALAGALTALGKKVALCGNIGYPVLRALLEPEVELFVLELSSYQLELCPTLKPEVGAVLNLSPDHLNRYDHYRDYIAAKAKLAAQAQSVVLNADDAECRAMSTGAKVLWFGAHTPNRLEAGQLRLHEQVFLSTPQLVLHGEHNAYNLIATALMLEALGFDPRAAQSFFCQFSGLPHRMQCVVEREGVRFFDDSKATNIGATTAALQGIAAPYLLILGGEGKGQDFAPLAQQLQAKPPRAILLIGVDNGGLITALKNAGLPFEDCGTMDKAVARAKSSAQSGDWVVLSPACASHDQYSGYDARGDDFKARAAHG